MNTNNKTSLNELAAEVFENCTDGMVIVDKAGRFIMANSAISAIRLMFGFKQNVPLTIQETINRIATSCEEQKNITSLWRRDIACKKPPAREFPVTRANGEKRLYKFQLTHLHNGYHCLRVKDITDTRNVECALKNSEEMFRNLAEQSPNMIFIYKHVKNHIVYANRHCEILTGYKRSELYSPRFNFTSIIAPEFHERMHQALKRHLTGKELPIREYDLLSKKGTRISVVLSTRLIHFDDDPALLGIMTDVTEMKKVQQDIVESAILLKEQKKALQEKNTALKEILAQIETEKLQIRRQISINAEKLLLPMLKKLETSEHTFDRRYVKLLESNIRDLVSRFGAEIVNSPARLSPKEVELCNMIRNGLSSKDMAELLHISVRTVDTHRNRIRKKLGISSRDINLATHLQNLAS